MLISGDNGQKKKGLMDAHAYTMINAKTLTPENGGPIGRFVKIRNPYGSKLGKEWELDWSDKSLFFLKQFSD